jgi:hypothetical protein
MSNGWQGPSMEPSPEAGGMQQSYGDGGGSFGSRFGAKTWLSLALAVFVTIGSLVVKLQQDDLIKALSTNGRTTAAQVVSVTETRRRGVSSYTAHYTFVIETIAYYGDKPVSASEASNLHSGDLVQVMYVASDPKRNIGESLPEAKERASRYALVMIGISVVSWLGAIRGFTRGSAA